MTIPAKYLRDRLILLLLSANVFLALLTSIFVLLRLSSSNGSGYIAQYRPALGISAYTPGNILDLISFVVFALLILAIHVLLSIKTYNIHRQLAVAILGLGVLLLVLTLIVSNALLLLR